jgi:hypothetical protein
MPSALVVVEKETFFARLVAVNAALGITAPEESFTTPVICASKACPNRASEQAPVITTKKKSH